MILIKSDFSLLFHFKKKPFKMKTKRNLSVLILVLIAQLGLAQYTLSIQVDEVKNAEGHILAAVYTSKEAFLKFESVYKTCGAKSKAGTTLLTIKDLPKGIYAVAIFHDENDNNELDTNMLGIPKEPIAFSKGKMKLFGPPNFEDCAFILEENMEIRTAL